MLQCVNYFPFCDLRPCIVRSGHTPGRARRWTWQRSRSTTHTNLKVLPDDANLIPTMRSARDRLGRNGLRPTAMRKDRASDEKTDEAHGPYFCSLVEGHQRRVPRRQSAVHLLHLSRLDNAVDGCSRCSVTDFLSGVGSMSSSI